MIIIYDDAILQMHSGGESNQGRRLQLCTRVGGICIANSVSNVCIVWDSHACSNKKNAFILFTLFELI